MCRGHVNEKLHTTFRNSGRVAGTGILYDRYDDESGTLNMRSNILLFIFHLIH